LTLTDTGNVTQSQAINVGRLELLGSGGDYQLTDTGNAIGTLAGNTGTVTVTDDSSLTIGTAGGSTGLSVSGPLSLTTLNGGKIAIDAALTGTTVDLISAGTISGDTSGIITAGMLTGSAAGEVVLTAANAITDLGPFTVGRGGFSLTDAAALTVDGAIDAGNLTLKTTGTNSNLVIDAALTSSTAVDLISAGTIGGNAAGVITARTLIGSSVGAVTLTADNSIDSFGAFTTHDGALTLTDGRSLTINGKVDVGTGGLSLMTLNSGSIVIDGTITGTSVDLTSAGTIGENGSGIITAGSLTGSSAGATTLMARGNDIADLEAFSTSAGAFSLTDAATLTVNGAVNVSGGKLTLNTTGTNHNLVVDAALTDTGRTVDLISAKTISSNGSGIITAGALDGSSVGSVTLTADNLIGRLGAFSTGNGAFSLTDAGSLTVAGAVNAGTGALSLTTLDSGNIAIDAALKGATVDLTSAGNVTESTKGAVIANLLNVAADTGISLTSALNNIHSVGTDTTTSGPNRIKL
jgi:hypothetical protein